MNENKLKPFDLEKAKQGAKVVTRDGRNVRIICWDRVESTYPIVALVKDKDGTDEDIETYTLDGACVVDQEHNLDLFMAPTVVERWVNVYKNEDEGYYNGCYYETEQEARQKIGESCGDYVTTIKITWEE